MEVASVPSAYNLNILVVDDHPVVRHGLVEVLTSLNVIRSVDEAGNGEEAFGFLERKKYDVVLLDLEMPKMNGLQFLNQLPHRSIKGDPKIIVISTYSEPSKIMAAYESKASGYIMKDIALKPLRQALMAVADGQTYYSEKVSKILLDNLRQRKIGSHNNSDLSDREISVLVCLCQRLSNEDIAAKLFISPLTVKTHRANIRRKLGAKDEADCILYAISNGLYVV